MANNRDRNKQLGASLVEYALLLVLIAILAMVAIRTVGQNASQVFSDVASNLSGQI
ncbi:MAG: hypothetical protein KDD56_07960 [Bdellovibrionales bacterium]|nr:hypothetical protein [Bdellovibrionales bacterium]